MTAAGPIVRTGAYVPGAQGPRLRLVSAPAGAQPRGTVIAVHAFAEEMNKSRRMCARLASMLAGEGWRVVQSDLAGCGDSSGEFRDATWSAWVADLRDELLHADPERPVWLWCVRAGALLAAPALAGLRRDTGLLLWQPVTSGAQHLQQFLRLHVGARIVGAGAAGEGPSVAQRLKAGATVELGGYELSAALAGALEQASFDLPAEHAGRIAWFEMSADDPASLSPAATRTIDRLRARGTPVVAEALHGELFWQTQEIAQSESLLARSCAALADAPASGPASPARAIADPCHG
jgi:exosortase A-associated hydrolase 2